MDPIYYISLNLRTGKKGRVLHLFSQCLGPAMLGIHFIEATPADVKRIQRECPHCLKRKRKG
ncbi:MAG TPA: hypothetical protein DDW65_21655 [Firmicutes bacterium]|nr:hypothetical protein [Bacillota bacterium]